MPWWRSESPRHLFLKAVVVSVSLVDHVLSVRLIVLPLSVVTARREIGRLRSNDILVTNSKLGHTVVVPCNTGSKSMVVSVVLLCFQTIRRFRFVLSPVCRTIDQHLFLVQLSRVQLSVGS